MKIAKTILRLIDLCRMETVIKCPCCSEDFIFVVEPYIQEYKWVIHHLAELKTSIEDLNKLNLEKIGMLTKGLEK